MNPTDIPRPQAARVQLYEEQIGPFDSTKNAYWSLREGRPVTLAEGSRLDMQHKTGARYRQRTVLPPPTVREMTGAGRFTRSVPSVRSRLEQMQAGQAAPVMGRTAGPDWMPVRAPTRWGRTGMRYQGPGDPGYKVPKVAPKPPEISYAEARPDQPTPGRTDDLFTSVMQQLTGAQRQARPDAVSRALAPGRPLTSVARDAAPGAADAAMAPPMDLQKLILPAVVVGAALLAAKML